MVRHPAGIGEVIAQVIKAVGGGVWSLAACLLKGHEDMTDTSDPGVYRLTCQRCGRQTSGWQVPHRGQHAKSVEQTRS